MTTEDVPYTSFKETMNQKRIHWSLQARFRGVTAPLEIETAREVHQPATHREFANCREFAKYVRMYINAIGILLHYLPCAAPWPAQPVLAMDSHKLHFYKQWRMQHGHQVSVTYVAEIT